MRKQRSLDSKLLLKLFPLFIFLLGSVIFWGYYFKSLPIDKENASMEGKDLYRQKIYSDFLREFNAHDQLLLSFTNENEAELEGLCKKITSIPGVKNTVSLKDFEKAKSIPSLFLSKDKKTRGVVINLKKDSEPSKVALALDALKRSYPSGEIHLTGLALQKAEVASLLQKDLNIIIPLSTIVLAISLFLLFRQYLAVIIPLVVTGITIVWTLGLYSFLGYSLNTITSLLPPVIMVLSVANTVHIYQSWLEFKKPELSTKEQLTLSLKKIFFPCLFTTITTCLGLGSLAFNDIPAVQQFGIFASIGICLSLVFAFLITPICILVFGCHCKEVPHTFLDSFLKKCVLLTDISPKKILLFSLLFSAILLPGIFHIKNNTNLLLFLKEGNPLRRDSEWIESSIGGVNTIDLVWTSSSLRPLTKHSDYQRLKIFQERLNSLEGVNSSQSLSTLLENTSGPLQNQSLASFSQRRMDRVFKVLKARAPDSIYEYISKDFTKGRIQISLEMMGTSKASLLLEKILEISEETLGKEYHVEATGAFYQVIKDSNGLVRNLIKSFLIAFSAIILVIGLYFRSWKVIFISIIPNIQPIIWTMGIMGYLGISLSTGTAMIASVTMGIVVDDTIHYLTRFYREKHQGISEAIHISTTRTGRAMVISSLVLALGFAIGAFGSFLPTIYFSILTALTMLSAVICDLLILPSCLYLFRSKTS